MNNNRRIERQFEIIRPGAAILIALCIAFIFIVFSSEEPVLALKTFITGPLTTTRRMGNVVETMVPLLFTGCAVCVMYSANQINMAGEGAFFLGAITAAYIGINWILPVGIHPAVAIIFGGLVGAVVCVIPGILEIKWDAKPVVSSIMLNYICLYIGLYINNYVIRDTMAGFMASEKFQDSSMLSNIWTGTNVHSGVFIAIVAVICSYFYLYKSKYGYEIRVVGKNKNFAKYSGMKVVSIVIWSQLVGGFIAGVGGATQMLGMYNRFQYTALPEYGFDGILIAILARNNPKYVPLTSLFLAYIRTGAEVMARETDVPVEIVQVVQAVIILLFAAQLFLENWKHRQIVKAAQLELEEAVKADAIAE